MPDNSSGSDDPFADLYGKLPDPRRRGSGSDASTPTSRRAARAARSEGSAAERPAEPVRARPDAEPVPARRAPDAARRAPEAAPPRGSGPAGGHESIGAREPASVGAAARGSRATAQTRPAASGTLEDLFTGERTADELGAPPPPKNRRGRTGRWIALIIVLALVGGVVGGGVWAWNTFGERVQGFFAGTSVDDFEDGRAHGEAQITVAPDDTGVPVSQKLYDAGVTKTPTSLYDYMVENSVAFTFHPGVYRLQLEMSSPAVLEALRNPENRLENTTQLREGLTVQQSIETMAEQMAMPIEDLEAAVADPAAYGVAADSLEGWLFPATYTFDPGTTATDAIARMVNRTIESLDTAGVPVEDRQRILTVASIIQREARFEDDFYKVSRVIQNRLDQGMKLQMDSTAQYGYGELHEGSASTSGEAQYDDNPWNTYVVDGLPAGPIANPGDLAIDAAMKPAEGPWLFFVTVNLDTGETVFTTNADEHQQAVDQWIDWCRDHPDSGC
jgi:UPF0755 protein